MMDIFFLLLVIIAPWFLGFAMVRACLKSRFHSNFYAIGVGFYISILITHVSSLLSRKFDLVLGQSQFQYLCFCLGILIFFSFKPKTCYIEEQRHFYRMPVWKRMLLILFLCLFIVNFLSITLLALSLPDRQYSDVQAADYLISYTSYVSSALPLSVRLPWLIQILALGCTFFGALRYLQIDTFTALLVTLIMLCLPQISSQVLDSQTDVFISGFVLCVVTGCIHVSIFRENRQIFLVLLGITGLWHDQVIILIFIIITILSIVRFGKKLGGVFGCLLLGFLSAFFDMSPNILDWSAFVKSGEYMLRVLFFDSQCHLLFYILSVSLCLWILLPKYAGEQFIKITRLYIWVGLIMVLYVSMTPDVTFVNSKLTQIIPVLCILPVLVFESCHLKFNFG